MHPTVGEVLEGKVTGITKFGAFVALPGGGSGLVHISEIANAYVSDVHDYIEDGQTVKVKVISVGDDGKVSLSIKKALPPVQAPIHPPETMERRKTPPASSPAPAPGPDGYVPVNSGDAAFEDKLKHFMQDAESRMSDNRAYVNKKGSYRHKKS